MAAPDPSSERGPLLRSIALTGAIGALGIAWGIASGSQMVLLDGAYALIGLVVSWLLLLASRLAGSEPGGRFPFGKESVTPLVIGVQGFVMLATLVYAAFEAAAVIRQGGSDVTASWAIAYSAISTVASIGFWLWLRSVSGDSDLLVAEATAWRVGAFRGLGMLVGFVVMALLERSSWSRAAAYVDPAMVLVTFVVFLPSPLRMVRGTVLELLEGEPDDEILTPVLDAVTEVARRHAIGDPVVRTTKLGPKLYVEAEATVDPSVTIAEQHHFREDLRAVLDTMPFDLWLNVELLPRDTTTARGAT